MNDVALTETGRPALVSSQHALHKAELRENKCLNCKCFWEN